MARYRNPITTYIQRKIEKNTPTIIKQTAYTLQEALEFARAQEIADSQATRMERGVKDPKPAIDEVYETRVTTKTHESRKKCFFCGGKLPHQGGRTKCPAWSKECKICNKPNHFAKCCKGSSNQKKIRTIEDKEDSDPSSDSSDNTSIYNVGTVNGRATDVERRPVRTVKIDNKDINVLIDTEATVKHNERGSVQENISRAAEF
jgi:hypothetical protein